MHPLHDGRQAFQPHAGVDRGARQRVQRTLAVAVVLHEDQVPDLDKAVTVLFRRTGWAAGHLRSVVIEDLRARAARAGVAHRPEVVLGADAGETRRVDLDVVQPDVRRFFVFLEHRHPQALGRQLHDTGQELPGKADGLALEVIAKAEVAQHFEEGVMAGGIADVFQVVVLAAGPHTALAGGGTAVVALLLAEKHVLELDHAGIDKQQGRIIDRHQRTRRHDLVVVRPEKLQKGPAKFRAACHLGYGQ